METRGALLVIYATQTGCAEEVASRIGREAERLRFAVDEKAIDAYDVTKLSIEKRPVIFVVSTTGQGEVPDSMKQSWTFLLRKAHPSDLLAKLQFTVFGLGDSSYVQFNVAAKKLYRRLLALGAQAFHPKGEGDDQHKLGIDGALDPWLSTLFQTLSTLYPLPPGLVPHDNTTTPQSRYLVELISNALPAAVAPPATSTLEFSQKRPFVSRMVKNERITASDWNQDVRHLEFDLSGSNIRYDPGDVVCILPQSPEPLVKSFLDQCGLTHDQLVRVRDTRDASFVVEGTLLEVISKHFDVVATPRRYFFELLSHFTADPREKERLQYFSSAEGQEDARDYSYRERKSPEEVLQDFPTTRPLLSYLFDLLPRIQPRSFSISSAQIAAPTLLSISMVVVKWQTRFGKRQRIGLCSGWLSSLQVGSPVPLWVKPGTFRIRDESKPIIMIGPGTGCAIFRAYLHSRHTRLASTPSSMPAETVFFFGCRHESKDFIYRDEWTLFVASGALSRLQVAFSRDQPTKRYVQHLIQENGAQIWALLLQGASIYVSGSSRGMPEQVRQTFRQIIQDFGKIDQESADRYLLQLAVAGKYCTETWS